MASPDRELELLYQINEDTFDGGLYMLEHDIVESGIDNYYVADYKFAGNKREDYSRRWFRWMFFSTPAIRRKWII